LLMAATDGCFANNPALGRRDSCRDRDYCSAPFPDALNWSLRRRRPHMDWFVKRASWEARNTSMIASASIFVTDMPTFLWGQRQH